MDSATSDSEIEGLVEVLMPRRAYCPMDMIEVVDIYSIALS